jgi:hypothetical protein
VVERLGPVVRQSLGDLLRHRFPDATVLAAEHAEGRP